MSFYKVEKLLRDTYSQHNLSSPDLRNYSETFLQLFDTIANLLETLDNYSREAGVYPYHQLKKELGKLSYYFLANSYPDNLGFFSKRVSFLQSVLDSLNKAAIKVADPYVSDLFLARKPDMIIGIEKSMLHSETSCCNLFGYFNVNPNVQLCNDVSNAVQGFNEVLERSINNKFLL